MTHRTRIPLLIGGALALALAVAFISSALAPKADPAMSGSTMASRPDTAAVAPSNRQPTPAAPPAAIDGAEALRLELLAAESFRDIHDRLVGKDPALLEPHEQFFLAFILETCHRGAGVGKLFPGTSGASGVGESPEQVRARERLNRRSIPAMCDGIVLGDGVAALIESLYEEAARRGDVRALAWRIQARTLANGTPIRMAGLPAEGVNAPAALDPEQRDQLMSILESRDPMAIAFAGRLLARRQDGMALQFGPDAIVPSFRLNDALWDLASCDFGANCGPNRLMIDHACASRGHCDAASLEDYLRRYVLTPQDLHDYARIRPYLTEALRNGDWSGVRYGPAPGDTIINTAPVRFGLGG